MTPQQFDFHIHLVCDHPGSKWPDLLNSVYQLSIGSPYQLTSGSDMGRDAHVTGVLAVPGTLRVEGRIDGEIDAAEVIVLAGGSIVGELRCDSANIQGTVRGVLRCIEHLDIKGRALVEGDVFYHKGLCVEAGATLNCSMTYQDDSTQVPRTRLPIEPSRPAPHDEGHSDKVSLMSRMFGSTKVSR